MTSYYPDIVRQSGKVHASHIDRVLRSIPVQLNQSYHDPITRFKFKGIVPGITHYARLADAIDWLEATGLVIKTKICEKENFFRLFLFDIGILGSMSHLSPKTILDAEYGSLKALTENFTFQELLAQGEENLSNPPSRKK